MNTTRKRSITLLHDDYMAGIATWFKAVFLTPFWMLPLLPLLGAVLAKLGVDGPGLAVLDAFLLLYFLRDLMRKKVQIDEKVISHSLTALSVKEITSIVVKRDRFKLPNILIINDANGRKIKLFASRLTGEAMQTIVDTVQKLAPQCQIDPEVDDILRRKQATIERHQDTASTVSINYNVEPVWGDLSGSFSRLFGSWSRFIGPGAAIIFCMPIWIVLVTGLYQFIMKDWASYEQNKWLYDTIISAIRRWSEMQGMTLQRGVDLFFGQLDNPLLLAAAAIIVLMALLKIWRSMFSANRITLDRDELSLDRWTQFWSYNTCRIKWADVARISLERVDADQAMAFTLRSEPRFPVTIDLTAVAGKDRARLLRAIKQFAPECEIDAQLIDLLEPSNDKSYTQLWLQSLSSAPERKSLEPIKSGELLDDGKYEVIRRLGVGGQGTAYLCYDLSHPELERAPVVALKETLVPMFVDNAVRQKTIEQFVAEAKMLAKIESPNVVQMLDYFIDKRGAYLVLEHIEGKTLRQLVLQDGKLEGAETEKLARQMLEILDVLHKQAIIHRDFTPDNLILTPQGSLKLIDFNVAQEDSQGTTATIVGKHAYVPPEQFRGKATSQSDLYALGATLYYLVMGHDPEPITPSALPEGLSQRFPILDSVIQQCTELDTTARVSSASDALSILDGGTAAPDVLRETAAPDALCETAAPDALCETAAPDALCETAASNTLSAPLTVNVGAVEKEEQPAR